MASQTPHLVLLPVCFSFTVPMVELARLAIQNRGFTATVLVLSDISNTHHQDEFLDSRETAGLSFEKIPELPFHDLNDDSHLEHRLAVTSERCAPYVANVLAKLKLTKNVVALVLDPASALANVEVAKQYNVPSYVFYTSSLNAYSYCFHLPELEEKITSEYHQLEEPLSLPGCVKLDGKDYLHGSQTRDGEGNKAMVRIFNSYKAANGILVNSFVELEPETYKALKEKESKGESPPVYAVGPVIPTEDWGDSGLDCLKWLDGQPKGSVLYIAFGTGGTLSKEQTAELAYGLEKSGQRFVWVIRWPTEKDGSGAYFNLKVAAKDNDVLSGLPDGFTERTKNQGFFVHIWAPQLHILKHSAVGGFLNLCGWGSVLESITFAVPMILYPLFAEQKINAVLLTESLGMALRLKVGNDGRVSRDEVAKVVKDLFEGEGGARVRARVKELQVLAGKALAKGGSAYKELNKWWDIVSQ